MTPVHIPISAVPIEFIGNEKQLFLRLIPDTLVRFPGHPVEDDLVQFLIEIQLPELKARSADELTLRRLNDWSSDLRDFAASQLEKTASIGIGKQTEGFDLSICSHGHKMLLEGRVSFPYRGWQKLAPTVITEQEQPFPWSVEFACEVTSPMVLSVASGIDRLLEGLPGHGE